MNYTLSVIIVNWNTSALLRQCLDSLTEEIRLFPSIEIIVVDNGSTDDSLKTFETWKKKTESSLKDKTYKLTLIKNKENLGFAKANNIGIRSANGQYIMLLNSDTIVKPEACKKLVEFLEKEERLAVSPELFLPDGSRQNEYYMKFPNLWQIFFYHQPILREMFTNNAFVKSKIFCSPEKVSFEVDQLPGAALAASKAVFEEVGLLDEDYLFLFEDVDWCWRAKIKKIKRMVTTESKIIHIGGASWKNKIKADKNLFFQQFFASWLLFVRKNYSVKRSKIFFLSILLNFIFTGKFYLALKFAFNQSQSKNFF